MPAKKTSQARQVVKKAPPKSPVKTAAKAKAASPHRTVDAKINHARNQSARDMPAHPSLTEIEKSYAQGTTRSASVFRTSLGWR